MVISYKLTDHDCSKNKNILIESVSDSVYSLLKYKKEEMIGKSLSLFVQANDLTKFCSLFNLNPSNTILSPTRSSNNNSSPASPSINQRKFTCYMAINATVEGEKAQIANKSSIATKPVPHQQTQIHYDLMSVTTSSPLILLNEKKETVSCTIQQHKSIIPAPITPTLASTTAINTTTIQLSQISSPLSVNTSSLPHVNSLNSNNSLNNNNNTVSGITIASPGLGNLNASNSGGNFTAGLDCNKDQFMTKMTKRGRIVWIDTSNLKNATFLNSLANCSATNAKNGVLLSFRMGSSSIISEFVHNNDISHINRHLNDSKSQIFVSKKINSLIQIDLKIKLTIFLIFI